MLAALRIESFAIVDSLEVRFERGLNVLTGETGAGKSILVDAVSLLLGGRADPSVIRAGCEEAVVEGLFTGEGVCARAAELGLPAAGGEVLVRRTIARGGRSRVHVGGALATASLLQALARGRVDVAGQHEHLSLLRRERHADLLDAYAGLLELRARYQQAFSALEEAVRARGELERAVSERARRADYLAFQLRELEEVEPRAGEDTSLAEERRVLASTAKLRAAAARALSLIEGAGEGDGSGGGAAALLAAAASRLGDAAEIDPRLAALRASIEGARLEVDEAARALARYGSSLPEGEGRLAEVDARLESIRRLVRRHGSIETALASREASRRELELLSGSEERLAGIEREIASHAERAAALARELSAARAEGARTLAGAVEQELARLAMGAARLQVFLGPAQGEVIEAGGLVLARRGAEDVELLLAANAGEPAAALARVASGGELSRVMLALRRTLASADPVETWIFDEVDAGISGATAIVVGRLLRESARDRQVLCVTHLPQVAAHADVHLSVRKQVRGGRTTSRVERLEGDGERARELARLVSGADTRAALAAAAELLEGARRRRRRAA